MTPRKEYYLKYLQSAHWKALRRAAFERDGKRCGTCGLGRRLRGHHLRYRQDLLDCTVDDIQTLCATCHDRLHAEKESRRKLKRNSYRWLKIQESDWFKSALLLPREEFKKVVRSHAPPRGRKHAGLRGSFVATAIAIWDRQK